MPSRETETLDLRHVGEVAAVIARNTDLVLGDASCLQSPALTNFWDASRKRADLWQFALDDALDASRRDQPLGKHAVHSASTVIGEVLATEMVTRLWTAVLVGHERLHQTQNEPLARRVLSNHLTARRSCLRLLTHPIALPSSKIVSLDRIRQRAERWTDCLLATLPDVCQPDEFTFDLERFREFTEDGDIVTRLSPKFSGWHLLALSLRVADEDGPEADRTRNALHRDVLNAIGSVIDAARPVLPQTDEAKERMTSLDDQELERVLEEHFADGDEAISNDAVASERIADADDETGRAETTVESEPAAPEETLTDGPTDVSISDHTAPNRLGAIEDDLAPQADLVTDKSKRFSSPALVPVKPPRKLTVTPDGLQFRTLFPKRR